MDEPQTPALSPGTLITDRLVVVRKIGSGGLGDVYEVEHKFTRHHRAVKVLHAPFRKNADVVERFLREASAAGRIGNRHIVETFDAGYLEDGSPFIVMEFLEGKPLNDVLRWNGHLEPGVACAVLAQVCGAIQAAHDANIIHRDLKPENLFVTEREGQAFIKVLDFGISKFQGADGGEMRSTRTGITMGTPLYMPPEQLRSARDVDPRSDVYSLGVILYELLVGRAPFVADSIAELMVKIMTEEPESPRAFDATIPTALSHVALKALSKDPAGRFSTAAEMGAALEPFARNDSVSLLLEHEVLPETSTSAKHTFVPQSGAKSRATPMPVKSRVSRRSAPYAAKQSRPGTTPSRPAATPAPREPEPALDPEPVAVPARGRGPLIGALAAAVALAFVAGGWKLLHADEARPPAPEAGRAAADEGPAPVRAPVGPPTIAEPPPVEVAPPVIPAPVVEEHAPEPPPVARAPEKVPRRKAEAAAAPSGPRGVVDLDCREAACTLELDGRPAGETPRLNLQVEAGSHVAVFTNMETKASTTRALNVKAGERLRVSVEW